MAIGHRKANLSRLNLMITALVIAMLAACDAQNSFPSASAGLTTTSGQQLERQRQRGP